MKPDPAVAPPGRPGGIILLQARMSPDGIDPSQDAHWVKAVLSKPAAASDPKLTVLRVHLFPN